MRLVVAAVQSCSIRGEVEQNIRHHIELTEVAADEGADLVVFPELSLLSYEIDIADHHALNPTDTILAPFQKLADMKRVHILVGTPYRTKAGLHIAAFHYQPNAAPEVYTKHFVHADEKPYFTENTLDLTIRLKGETISPAICYDVSNPMHAAQAAAKGSTLYVAGVMTTPKGYPAKEKHMREYAMKHGMATVLANYACPTSEGDTAGRSAVWSQRGTRLAAAPPMGEAIVFYVKDGEEEYGRVFIPDAI